MKAFKWVFIIILILAGLVLIVPVFLPATTVLAAEVDIEVEPEAVFHHAAMYTDRDKWDPWLEIDPEAKVTIVPNENYVGSTYSWDGEKIGTGMMRVEKVELGRSIYSSIVFGNDPKPSQVEWQIKKIEKGTHVTWKFISDGNYPFGRLMLMVMSGGMKSSFESGLVNLKELLEADPPELYKTGKIQIDMLPEITALVVPMEGTMEEISIQIQTLFPTLYAEMGKQQLQIDGPPFAYYIDFDEETEYSHAMLGIQVTPAGASSGDILAKVFSPGMAVMADHIGKYDYLKYSYKELMKYAEENQVQVEGGAFEIYQKTMMESNFPMEWVTKIAFPIK